MVAQDQISRMIEMAISAGASDAEAIMQESVSTSVRVRLGEVELVEQARQKAVGLRVFVGEQSAVTSTTDLSADSLDDLVMKSLDRAKLTIPVEHAGLPDADLFGEAQLAVDISDEREGRIEVDDAIDLCVRAEETALAVDSRLSKSEGAEFSCGIARQRIQNSRGCEQEFSGTSYSLYAVPIADVDGQMVRDHGATARRHFSDLRTPEEVGVEAAERTLRRVGAKSAPTGAAPVVFSPRMSGRMVGYLASALNGYSLYKGTSFLTGSMGKMIAPDFFTLIDDGTAPRSLGTRPVDGEGLCTQKTALIQEGVVAGYLLDTYTGRKLEMPSTRNAARGVGSAPLVSTSNLVLQPGLATNEELIESVANGLYVTELFGFGFNPTTGDFSQGAGGIWIQGGKLTYPVHEITIAGNFLGILQQIEAIGDKPYMESSTRAPSMKVSSMMVAGN